MEVFIMSCWSLWSNQNKVVHEGEGYKAAQTIFSAPRPPDNDKIWSPPIAGRIKAIQIARGAATVGVIARDHLGSVLAWPRFQIPYQTNPVVGWWLRLWPVVPLAQRFCITHVDTEGDCLKVVQQLNSTIPTMTSEGSIIKETCSLALLPLSLFIIKRNGNKLAHLGLRVKNRFLRDYCASL